MARWNVNLNLDERLIASSNRDTDCFPRLRNLSLKYYIPAREASVIISSLLEGF